MNAVDRSNSENSCRDKISKNKGGISFDPLQRLVKYQFGLMREYSAFAVDQIGQFSLTHDRGNYKAFLLNQAEINNAIKYKVNEDLKELSNIGKEVVDEYRNIAKDNIRRVRRSL